MGEPAFDLAEVRLTPPLASPGTVPKADLLAQLSGSRSPLVTVVAPAGYGKTTLLARWAEADPRPFAWLALDDRDDDPVVLLRSIATAIHRVGPLPPEVFDALSGPDASIWPNTLPRLGSALGALKHPLVLTFDDLHAVANPSCLNVLAGAARVRPGRVADRDREPGGARIARRSVAGARLGP